MERLRSRQVHLDFHTSEHLPGVGSRFTKANFQQALQIGKLNSITIFAKCHHGWCYYPSETGRMHPTLSFDLTGAKIEAAHEIGVKAPIYITVGWSANDADRHPEWCVRKQDGTIDAARFDFDAKPEDKRPIVSWKFLCPSGAYARHIYDLTREICNRYPIVDGLFYDICFGPLCWCENCMRIMEEERLDPHRIEDATACHRLKWRRFARECKRLLSEGHPQATVFFNGGAHMYPRDWHDLHTHFELEDLPTTWGGYDKMPARALFFARTGKDYLGMTGKFHTMWGEFGGFKPAAAMTYECAAMLAYGARCSIGDQMHPAGEVDLETYRLIGEAYDYVEQVEPWCFDAESTSSLGMVLSGNTPSDEGLVKMLLEKRLDFDIVSGDEPLRRFDAVILPDAVVLDEPQAERYRTYIRSGGNVLLTGKSGLDADQRRFMIDIGATYLGPARYENDYLQMGDALNRGMVTSPFLCYEGAERVTAEDGEILAAIREPYFNRTYARYCSHQNTPYRTETAEHPGAVRKGGVVYLAHPVCRLYFEHGAQFHRDVLINALQLIYPDPIMKVNMPSAGRARLTKQRRQHRYVLHLLYGSPIRRGRALVIEDLPPLYDVRVELQIKERIRRVYLAPQGTGLSFVQTDRRLSLTVPRVECHQIVVLDMA